MGKVIKKREVNPRGLRRPDAASYIGVSATLFDEMVDDGRMPKPREANSCTVWDRYELDQCFDELPVKGARQDNPWDEH